MNIKKVSLFIGLIILAGLLLISTSFLGYAKEITPPRVAPEECSRFEERIDISKSRINDDLEQGIITQEEANSELNYLEELESDFREGVLPRHSNSRRNSSENEDFRHHNMKNRRGFNQRHRYNHNRNEQGVRGLNCCR